MLRALAAIVFVLMAGLLLLLCCIREYFHTDQQNAMRN